MALKVKYVVWIFHDLRANENKFMPNITFRSQKLTFLYLYTVDSRFSGIVGRTTLNYVRKESTKVNQFFIVKKVICPTILWLYACCCLIFSHFQIHPGVFLTMFRIKVIGLLTQIEGEKMFLVKKFKFPFWFFWHKWSTPKYKCTFKEKWQKSNFWHSVPYEWRRLPMKWRHSIMT